MLHVSSDDREAAATSPPGGGPVVNGPEPDRLRAAWPAAVATAAVAIGLGAPLVVLSATGDELRHPALAAGLRATWIGLYALVGLWFAHRRRHRLLGLSMTAVGLLAALTSLDALPGEAAYTASRIVTFALIPAALFMLVALPESRNVRGRLGTPLLVAAGAVTLLSAAYMTVAETAAWSTAAAQCRDACAGSAIQVTDAPGVARAILVAMAALMLVAMAATGVSLVRSVRGASPITARTVTPVAVLTWIWTAPLYPAMVVLVVDPGPENVTPFLMTTAVIRSALPLALMAVVVAQAVRTNAVGEEMMSRLAGATDPARVEAAIAGALRDPSVRLAFRNDEGWIDVEGHAVPEVVDGDDRGRVALSLSGDQVGALTFDPGLHTQEERVQAIAALGSVALERARSEAELRAVRRRLVSVADEERRRVERTLHDGAQQRLVGMAIRVAAARDTLADRPEQALALLQELGVDVQETLDELRELAHGLYPAVLVDHGLPRALRAAARHAPMPVDVLVADVGRLDPLQEAAVYFCCSEALQNSAKHAGTGATTVVRLWREDGGVAFEVSDDGAGFVAGPFRPGTGLMGMRDRMEGVGGTLQLDTAPGVGTRVRGRLPLDQPAANGAGPPSPGPHAP